MADVKTPDKRLVDLEPRWVMTSSDEVYGIRYNCPCGLPTFDPQYDEKGEVKKGPDGKVIGAIPYDQCCAVGGWVVVPTKTSWLGKPMHAESVAKGWTLAGTSFENVTLSPSIHCVGHWHGWLQNGVLRSC